MLQQKHLLAVSYLAPNWFDFYLEIINCLNRNADLCIQLIAANTDPLLDDILQENLIDLAFICGLPLIQYVQKYPQQLQILAAPVMAAPRYQQRPIYFADIIFPVDRGITKLEDLRGKIFCYNDLGSNSGYNLLRYRLSQEKYPQPFFVKSIQSHSHQNSIRWVIDGIADCAAIDSLVLERELANFRELSSQLQVLEIDASPIPPLVVASHLGNAAIAQLRSCLLQPDEELKLAMKKMGVSHFVSVELADYQVLLEMSQVEYLLAAT